MNALTAAALLSAAAFAQLASSPAPASTPVRIGIVLPKAQLGQGNSKQDVTEPVRALLISYMSGPTLEVVPLQARIPAQIEAEARTQNVTHVLYTTVVQKKAGKGMGGMLGALAPAASMLPGLGAMGGASSAMIAGVATQAISAAAVQSAQEDAMASLTQVQAGSVKERDEITLTYRFIAISGAQAPIEETLKEKAEQDGQDLLGPLAEQVATKTVTAALSP
jgi:hypothetical protein